jgi:7-cyano-7-deazaguanine synthase
MMEDALILLSGGMDSGVLLAWSRPRYRGIHAISFDYGSKHAAKELIMAENLARTYDVSFTKIALPFVDELFASSLLKSGSKIPDGPYRQDSISSTVVPFRNGIMLSIAVGYAESFHISHVLVASHSGDHPIYPDCREEFTAAISRAAILGTFTPVKIEAPFASLDKRAIARMGRDLSFDFTKTWSCYKGLELHCGTCATCIERKHALEYDKGLDPTRYLE